MFVLCGLYPPLFLASNNWWMYASAQLFLVIAVSPVAAWTFGCLCYGVGRFVIGRVSSRFPRISASALEMATRVLSASIASLIAITLMSAVFFPEGQASVYSAVIVPTVVVLIATLIAKAGHFAINLVLLGMSGLAVLGLLVSHTKYGDLDVSAHLQPQKGKSVV